jgi:hypothetical protein
VIVIDPRHPLYDQTFPLLHLTNARNLIRCCVVQLPPDVERLIPITATNLASASPLVFSSPIDLSSLQRLITTFRRIQAIRAEEQLDEQSTTPTPGQPANLSTGYLGDLQHCATGACPPAPGSSVLSTAQPLDAGAQS